MSWLYDFEEQEGHLDFLTRVVVLTFHAGADGVPVTIGEVLFFTPLCSLCSVCSSSDDIGLGLLN